MQFADSRFFSPRQILLAFLLLSALLISAVFYQSLQLRVIGVTFMADGERLLMLEPGQAEGQAVMALGGDPENLLPVTAQDILEEPDVLETYRQYNAFMQQQTAIAGQFSGDQVIVQLADESRAVFALRERGLGDLRFGFYLQLLAGLVCVMIGAAIWAFNTQRTESHIYLLMGLSIALSCWSSAVYTTRELALDGSFFRFLSLVNHLGAAGFGGGLLGLFSIYPRRLCQPLLAWLLTSSFLLVWAVDSLQLTETIAAAFHLPLLAYVMLALVMAIVQWLATRKLPAERAILKWLLLSVMGTTMIFTTMNIIPAAFMATSLGAQAFTLTGFALGFVIMALGLGRYKLFNLDRWWFQYWTWFFAGIVVLVLDWLLLLLLPLEHAPALAIALALVGWLYMPARQKVWEWVGPRTETTMQRLLPTIVNRLFAARNRDDVHAAWRGILQEAFAPLQLEAAAEVEDAVLTANGQGLLAPSLPGESAWQLTHAATGSRLFSRQDIELVNAMFELVVRADHAIRAREEGVMAERGRIKSDLHDDLGARIMSIMHSTNLDQSQQHARQAMTELRSILTALEQAPCFINEAMALWRSEFEERILQADFDLVWQQSLCGNVLLTARVRHDLGRVLRELVSNALRYSGGTSIAITVDFGEDGLRIVVEDNGSAFDTEAGSGMGKRIVASRIADLGGRVEWQRTPAGACRVNINIGL